MSQDYNKTINLPKTDFQMRASLPQREPEFLKAWNENDLYNKLMKKNEGKPLYILHDGPPYANGDIHMGHALNKILKDFVLRYKNMSGFKAPYIPGWDTHGLPTELQAIKKLGLNRDKVSIANFREQCREFVEMYAANQSEQFQRLGVLGDWEHPYYTLHPEFEARQIEIFGKMAEKGFIYKGLKPVYWCPHDETALAEAEIEYAEDKCNSIYVKFAVTDDKGLFSKYTNDLSNVYFVIWTTTTWTLPGNVAICVGPNYEYSLVKAFDDIYVIATDLVASTMKNANISDYEVIGSIRGDDLEYMKTKHPFLDRESLVIVGDHVTLESGTGCVHTAPGHGAEDYLVCLNYKELEIIVPVDSRGYLNELAGKFEGLYYEKANAAIVEELKSTNSLLAIEEVIHQYPHCWRCKNPIIFRATEQWFCSIDSIKDEAVKAIEGVNWIPAWGEERIKNMVKDRNDWCISRQRTWGVPIPIFYCKDCGEPIITPETIDKVARLFEKEGSIAWYNHSPSEILGETAVCSKCGNKDLEKETDIMDVWFDSGVSHSSVLDLRENLSAPADLYLEGNDQYRGWFQSSLLTSIAYKGVAPYKTVLTHGFVVDGQGKKMSKSIGNSIAPSEIIKQYGADVLRLWVASSDYKADIKLSMDFIKQLSEGYRKIRNTARYILGNINDFNPNTDMITVADMNEIDKWAVYTINNLVKKVINAYENFEYHTVYHSIHNFCSVEMSNFYLDVIKDRLYCDDTNSKIRRSSQSAMYIILKALTKLIAPLLSFTSEEIWSFVPKTDDDDAGSVLFNEMPKFDETLADEKLMEKWNKILAIRDDMKRAIEPMIKDKTFKAALETKIIIYANDNVYDFVCEVKKDLKDAFIVSDVEVINGENVDALKGDFDGISIKIEKATGGKCERCWTYSDYVTTNKDHPTLCERCANVIGNL